MRSWGQFHNFFFKYGDKKRQKYRWYDGAITPEQTKKTSAKEGPGQSMATKVAGPTP